MRLDKVDELSQRPFELQTPRAIREWLEKLPRPGQGNKIKSHTTIKDVSNYTGIPHATLELIVEFKTDSIGMARRMQLSKMMAMIENGQLKWMKKRKKGNYGAWEKVGVIVENPRPKMKFQVRFNSNGVSLIPAPRPKPVIMMPSFADIFKTRS